MVYEPFKGHVETNKPVKHFTIEKVKKEKHKNHSSNYV
jgi:hypothetical protein